MGVLVEILNAALVPIGFILTFDVACLPAIVPDLVPIPSQRHLDNTV